MKAEYIKLKSVIPLGKAENVGEFKKLLEKYPDEIPFCFRNQPRQALEEFTYEDGTVLLAFVEDIKTK